MTTDLSNWIGAALEATSVMGRGLPKVEQALADLLAMDENEPIDHEKEHMDMGAFVKHLRDDHGMPPELAEQARRFFSSQICAHADRVRARRTLLASMQAIVKTQRTQAKYLRLALEHLEAKSDPA